MSNCEQKLADLDGMTPAQPYRTVNPIAQPFVPSCCTSFRTESDGIPGFLSLFKQKGSGWCRLGDSNPRPHHYE